MDGFQTLYTTVHSLQTRVVAKEPDRVITTPALGSGIIHMLDLLYGFETREKRRPGKSPASHACIELAAAGSSQGLLGLSDSP